MSETTQLYLNLNTQPVTLGTYSVTLNNGPEVHIPYSQASVNTSDTNTRQVTERGRTCISRAIHGRIGAYIPLARTGDAPMLHRLVIGFPHSELPRLLSIITRKLY
jgi:hypothetical protein